MPVLTNPAPSAVREELHRSGLGPWETPGLQMLPQSTGDSRFAADLPGKCLREGEAGAWVRQVGADPNPSVSPRAKNILPPFPQPMGGYFPGRKEEPGWGDFSSSLRRVLPPSVLVIQNPLRRTPGSSQTSPVISEPDSFVWPQHSKNIRGN